MQQHLQTRSPTWSFAGDFHGCPTVVTHPHRPSPRSSCLLLPTTTTHFYSEMRANLFTFGCFLAVIGDRWTASNSQAVDPDSDIIEKVSRANQVFSGKVSRIYLNGRESLGVNLDTEGRIGPGIEARCLVRVKTMLKGADGHDPLLAMFPQRTVEIVLQSGEEDVPRPFPFRVFHTAFFLVRLKEDGTVRLVTRPLEMTLDNIIAVRSAVSNEVYHIDS